MLARKKQTKEKNELTA